MVASAAGRPRLVAGLRLLHVVGQGGEGEVWEARDERGRRRALKLIRPDALVDPEQVEVRGRHLVRIDHPALVAVHRCGVLSGGSLDGWGFVEMDLVEGTSLQHAPADPSLLDRLVPLAEALDLLHAGHWSDGLPLVHRDVKPSNILERPDGEVVLVDPSTLRGVDATVLTRIGTPLFAAPEVVTGRVGPPADVYSFAATVVAVVTGARGNALGELLEDPSGLDLPEGVRRALSPLPQDRPSSCREVLSGARSVAVVVDDDGWHPVLVGPEPAAPDDGWHGADGWHDEDGWQQDEERWDDDEGWSDEDWPRDDWARDAADEPAAGWQDGGAWDEAAWHDGAWEDDEPRDRTLVDWAVAAADVPAPSGPQHGAVPPWHEQAAAPRSGVVWGWFTVLAVVVAVALVAPLLALPRWQPLAVAGGLHLAAHLVAGRSLLAALVVPPAAWGQLLAERAAPAGRLRTWTAVTATGGLLATTVALLRLLVPDVLARVSASAATVSPDLAAIAAVVGLLAAGLASLAAAAGGVALRLLLLPAWALGAAAHLAAAVVVLIPSVLLLRPLAPFRLAWRTLTSSAELLRGPLPDR